MARRWSRREDIALTALYRDGVAVREIANQLRRSEDAISCHRRALAIAARRRRWTAREDVVLAGAARSGVSARVVAQLLGRSVYEVRRRRRTLGLAKASSPRYGVYEDAALRSTLHNGTNLEELAAQLGRSSGGLRLRAAKLGLLTPQPRRRWSASEDAAVRDGYDTGLRCATIAHAMPGRTSAAVAARARHLGLPRHGRLWTASEEGCMRRLAAERTAPELAVLLARTPEAVRQRARKLQIALIENPHPERWAVRWTAAEDELLRLHPGLNPAALAQLLGRTDRAIIARMARLGLREGRERSPHYRTPGRAASRSAGRTS